MIKKMWLIMFLAATLCCMKAQSPFPIYSAIDASEGRIPIEYEVVDIPVEHRIEVSFTNKLDQAVCLSPYYDWPGRNGAMAGISRGIFMIVAQQRYEGARTGTDYCPGCELYVMPGETIRTSIPYDAFHLPDALVNEEKHLEFIPKAFRCEKRK